LNVGSLIRIKHLEDEIRNNGRLRAFSGKVGLVIELNERESYARFLIENEKIVTFSSFDHFEVIG